MNLAEVERLVHQLDHDDQRSLAEGIWKQLEVGPPTETDDERRARRLAALARCDEIAATIEGEFDSAEDMRRLREQRIRDIDR